MNDEQKLRMGINPETNKYDAELDWKLNASYCDYSGEFLRESYEMFCKNMMESFGINNIQGEPDKQRLKDIIDNFDNQTNTITRE